MEDVVLSGEVNLRPDRTERSRIFAAPVVGALLGLLLGSCSPPPALPPNPPEVVQQPTPPAPPKPPPSIYVSSRRLDTAKLFNGLQVRSSVETEVGTIASTERAAPESYALDLQLKIKVPKPNSDLQSIAALNEHLPAALPGLAAMLEQPRVSGFYEELYRLKIALVQRSLVRLEQIPSRHNFYDCETIIELEHPTSKRKALLIQADMDVDMDGSDSDRVPVVDGSSMTFQPMTSYRWGKKSEAPNPFLAGREEKLKQLEKDYAAKGLSADKNKELKATMDAVRYEVSALKKYSFLVSAADPYIALPGSMVAKKNQPFSPRLGDYCAVIYGKVIYPAIVGDVGPTYKMGEASLRLCKELNTNATASNRPVSDLKVTYLVFPQSAEAATGPPDLIKWQNQVAKLIDEIGGCGGELHIWEDLTKPPPVVPPAETPPAEVPPSPVVPGITVEPAASPATPPQ